jgi:hypothetical protein
MSDPTSDKVNASLGIYGGFTESTADNDGLDRFERTQEPKLPPTSDPLARFVIARIIEAETEPRGEVIAAYDLPAGPMAHRYAKHVRRDMVVFRRIVELYLYYASDVDAGSVIESAMLAVANRWSDHRDFAPAWSIE